MTLWPRLLADNRMILPAEHHDLEVCAQLHASAFARGWSESELADLLRDPQVRFLVLQRITSVLGTRHVDGFIIMRIAGDEAEVLTLVVNVLQRGQGCGAELLEAGVLAVRQQGVREVFLEVDEHNAAAVRLYKGHGFEQVGIRSGYTLTKAGARNHALVMRRNLVPHATRDTGAGNATGQTTGMA